MTTDVINNKILHASSTAFGMIRFIMCGVILVVVVIIGYIIIRSVVVVVVQLLLYKLRALKNVGYK